MVSETTLMIETEPPIPMTVANDVGIEKGAILMMHDPFTASGSVGIDDVVAGIAAAEKIADDGNTTLAVYRRGIFKGTASGSINVGDTLGNANTGGVNVNTLYDNRDATNLSGSRVVGISFEDATNTHTFLFELNPQQSSHQL